MLLGAFLKKACPFIVKAMEGESTSLEDNPFQQQMKTLASIGYPMCIFAPFPQEKDLRAIPFKFWKELIEAQLQQTLTSLPSFVPSSTSSSAGVASRENGGDGGTTGEGGEGGEA
mmetsp:Transcript_34041/g.87450  ORF Transcript_34041/g.87450 Transcript_34041/m.87450 type:complete len:115 (+) Transcript_34041:6985-7329(+)